MIMKVQKIDLSKIRIRDGWDLREKGKAMAGGTFIESIKKNGLLNPVLVVPTNDGMFDLIVGERRFLAHKRLNYKNIDCQIRKAGDTDTQKLWYLDSYLERDTLSNFERGVFLKKKKELIEKLYPDSKAGVAQIKGMLRALGKENVSATVASTKQVAKSADIGQRTAQRAIRIQEKLSKKCLSLLEEDHLTQNRADLLTQVNDHKLQDKAVDQILGLNLKDCRTYVAEIQETGKAKKLKTIHDTITETDLEVNNWTESIIQASRILRNQFAAIIEQKGLEKVSAKVRREFHQELMQMNTVVTNLYAQEMVKNKKQVIAV